MVRSWGGGSPSEWGEGPIKGTPEDNPALIPRPEHKARRPQSAPRKHFLATAKPCARADLERPASRMGETHFLLFRDLPVWDALSGQPKCTKAACHPHFHFHLLASAPLRATWTSPSLNTVDCGLLPSSITIYPHLSKPNLLLNSLLA